MQHVIDLSTLVPSTNNTQGICGDGGGQQNALFSDGELKIHAPGDIECVETVEKFSLPLRIDATVKTDSTNIRLYYIKGEVIFNWECNPGELRIHDVITGNNYGYHGKGGVPKDEYVDIAWVIGKRRMEVFVNGEPRLQEDSYPYMGLLMLEPDRVICESVRISAAWGSAVTVKALTVTELEG